MGDGKCNPDNTGLCFVLTLDGSFLGRGILEWADTRLTLRRITPSGAIATAFFGRGERQFSLVFPDQHRLPVHVSRCQWANGQRVCDIVPLSYRTEAADA